MTGETGQDARDAKGRFAPGNPGGPGRKRRRPLRDVVTFEAEAGLWALHLQEAMLPGEDGRSAREFVLRHAAGNPYQACPDIPPIAWPAVMSLEDLAAAVGAALTAHAQGAVDGAGLTHLLDVLTRVAKVFEVAELGPKLRRIEEHLEALGGEP